jgi:hypothetical protein
VIITSGQQLRAQESDISHIVGQVDTHNHGNRHERIQSGVLTAGSANAFAFTWQNPHPWDVIVYEVLVEITTAGGTAGSQLDVGSAASATTSSNNMINDGDLNTVAFLRSSAVVRLDEANGTTDWITGQILVQNASSLVGKFYIRYMEV